MHLEKYVLDAKWHNGMEFFNTFLLSKFKEFCCNEWQQVLLVYVDFVAQF
jgi:hypothetical protein